MGRPDDFDLIDAHAAEKESRSLWWLAVAIAVIGFSLAVGVALLILSSRLKGAPSVPGAQIGVTNTVAEAVPTLSTPPTPISIATATLAPSATPSPPPTPTPPCVHALDSALGLATVGSLLGCPQTAPGRIIWAAWEPFERGSMLWRSDTDQAYLFANNGQWSPVAARWSGEEQSSRGAPPPGLLAPVRGFGYVWGVSEEIFNQLGWATDEEKGFCARVQAFEHGFVLQSEAVASCTAENLYNHATSTDWQPIRFGAHNDGSWR